MGQWREKSSPMIRIKQPQFSRALRFVRKARGKSQEYLDVASGRTYVSALERGIKQPTIGKAADLASCLDVHPLTLLALSFLSKPTPTDVQRLLDRIGNEIAELVASSKVG